ncbi:MAG: TolC family protein, partial [Planctomycetales bacterium]|nr:TolC family protein [Planctomycetales bacterium]
CETTAPQRTISFAPVPNPAISQPGPASDTNPTRERGSCDGVPSLTHRVGVSSAASLSSIVTASHAEPAAVPPAEPEANANGSLLSDVTTRDRLALDELVAEVLERNPTAHAMYSAWQAAAQKYPQVVALDDPMLMYMVAPKSYSSSSTVQESWTIQLSQKFPWPGKLDKRGQIAAWEAHAAGWDAETTRRQLQSAVKLAFADYLLAHEQIRLNNASLKLFQDLYDLARTKFENNLAPQQDMLQAEVDIGGRKLRAVELEQMRRVAAGRINTLLHLPADAALPPPGTPDAVPTVLPPLDELTRRAVDTYPELSAKAARLASEQAAVDLAAKEFWPDVDLFARYDKMWMDREQQAAVGLTLNLPVQRDRRRAAVNEAVARVNQRCHELQSQTDQVQFEVQSAHAKLAESELALQVYRQDILPAAERNVSAASAAYEANTLGLLPLVEAQRQLIDNREKAAEAAAEQQRRWAELERVVGKLQVDQ